MINENLAITEDISKVMINSSPVGIAYLDSNGSVIYTNPMLNEMLGISGLDGYPTIEEKILELLDTKRTEDSKKILNHLLVGEKIFIRETEYMSFSGSKKWISLYGTPNFDSDGEVVGAILMCEDITAYKELQSQLNQFKNLESVEQLVGGVVHDFNNLLHVISGQIDLTLMSLNPDDHLYDDLTEVQKAAARASNFTERLLSYNRQNTLESNHNNLNDIILSMEKMLRLISGNDIELKTSLASDLWDTRVNQSQIEQIIINLAVNARDAMPQGGELTIETENTELSNEYVDSSFNNKSCNYIMLSITDTGCGMSNEVKEKIFDSYFTTKNTGKGTGLGLSIVYGIVKQYDGYIWIDSECGYGSTFKILLPTDMEIGREMINKDTSRETSTGYDRILIVEDDDSVREMATKILKKSGYNVLSANPGDVIHSLKRKIEKSPEMLLTNDCKSLRNNNNDHVNS